MLAIYLARLHVEHCEASDLLRSAIHCWVAGAATLLVALALLAMVVGMHAGLWDGNSIDTPSTLSILGFCVLTAGVTAVTTTVTTSRRPAEFAGFTILGLVMVLGAFTARALDASGPCLFAVSAAAIAAISGWQLARKIGAELACSAVRI